MTDHVASFSSHTVWTIEGARIAYPLLSAKSPNGLSDSGKPRKIPPNGRQNIVVQRQPRETHPTLRGVPAALTVRNLTLLRYPASPEESAFFLENPLYPIIADLPSIVYDAREGVLDTIP